MQVRRREALAGLALGVGLLTVTLLGCSSGSDGSPDVIGTPGGGVSGNRPVVLAVEPEATCASGGTLVKVYGRYLATSPPPQVAIDGVAAAVLATGFDGTTGLDTVTVRTGVDSSAIPAGGRLATVRVTTEEGTGELRSGLLLLRLQSIPT